MSGGSILRGARTGNTGIPFPAHGERRFPERFGHGGGAPSGALPADGCGRSFSTPVSAVCGAGDGSNPKAFRTVSGRDWQS